MSAPSPFNFRTLPTEIILLIYSFLIDDGTPTAVRSQQDKDASTPSSKCDVYSPPSRNLRRAQIRALMGIGNFSSTQAMYAGTELLIRSPETRCQLNRVQPSAKIKPQFPAAPNLMTNSGRLNVFIRRLQVSLLWSLRYNEREESDRIHEHETKVLGWRWRQAFKKMPSSVQIVTSTT